MRLIVNVDAVKGTPLRESAASKRGVEYEVANGDKIPNLGEKDFVGYTDLGQGRRHGQYHIDVAPTL